MSEKISELPSIAKSAVSLVDLIPVVRSGDNYNVFNENLFGGMPKSLATKVVAASDTPNAKARADYECDGIADDVEIQAALTALPAGGGTVVLLEGTYNLITTVTMPDDCQLEGRGWATILDVSGWTAAVSSVVMGDRCAIDNLKISGSIAPLHDYFEGIAAGSDCLIQNVWLSQIGHGISIQSKSNVHIRDMKFDQLKSTSGWSACINVSDVGTHEIFINNIYADDCDRGIEIEESASNVFCYGGYLIDIADMTLDVHTHIGGGGCENILFDGFYLENTSAINLGGLTGDRAANLTARNITVVTPTNLDASHGVVNAIYADHVVIENIVMEFAGHARAIYAQQCEHVVIKDCKCTSDTGNIILLDYASNISIRDNYFVGGVTRIAAAVAPGTAEHIVFDGNYVESGVSPVLRVETGVLKCRILNNHIVATGGAAYGVEIQTNAEDIDLIGNHIEGTGTYSIRASQTRGKIFHNTVDKRMRVEAAASEVWIHHNYIDELGIGDGGSTSPRYFMNYVKTDNAGFASAMGQIYSYSTANVTDPPTAAEINGIFGSARDVGSGFIGIINDNGDSLKFWLCISDNANWWYEGMTKAV